MGAGAKLLAVIVLLGAIFGVGSVAMNVYALWSNDMLEGLFTSAAGPTYFSVLGVSVFFSLCTFVLALMVLASRKRAPSPEVS